MHIFEDIGSGRIYLGDCLEVMQDIPAGVIDMVLCDLPYGTTNCHWDSIIPFEALWPLYQRITIKNSALVFTASQPFTSALVSSRIDAFKHAWVWDKAKPSNFPLAKKQPMKYHEDIIVFSFGRCPYFPIMRPCPGRHAKKGVNKTPAVFAGGLDRPDYLEKVYTDKYPSSLLSFSNADQSKHRYHPTQKPVALFEYLIRTYTQENACVLDNCAGGGTSAIAAENAGRRWVCIEKEKKYYELAVERIRAHVQARHE